jgi:hypothetical protein
MAFDVWCVVCDAFFRLTLKPSSAFAAEVLLDDVNRLSSTYPPLPPRSLCHMLSTAEGGDDRLRGYDAIAALRGVTFRVKRSSGAVEGCAHAQRYTPSS